MKYLLTLITLAFSTCLMAQDLERVYPDLELGSIASINIHESGVGYAPQECGMLLKTLDGGETWTQLFPDVSDVAYQGFVTFTDDNDPDKLVYHSQYSIIKTDDGFATSQNIKPNAIAGLMQDFIVLENGNYGILANNFYYSSDQGETWMETETPDVDGIDMMELDGILYIAYRAILRSADNGITFDTVFHNDDIKRQWVTLNDKPIISSSNNLYTSHDNGFTWEQIPAVEYYGYADNLTAYDGRLIANSSNRINYSDDEGVTWTSVIMPEGIYRTSSLFVNDTGTIFIGGEASQLYITDDPNTPIEVHFGNKEELNYITGQDDKLFATGNDGVLMRSEDYGASWTKSVITHRNLDISSFIGDRFFVLTDSNQLIRVADDNSTTAVLTHNSYFNTFEVKDDGQTAFLSGPSGIYRTDDGGDNWAEVYSHSSDISRTHLLSSGALTLLDSYGNIYNSDDNGTSWEILFETPDSNTNFLDFTVFDDMSCMILTNSFIYTTEDGGASWDFDYRPYNGQRLIQMNDHSGLCLGVNSSDGWLYQTSDKGQTFPTIASTCSTISRDSYYDESTQTLWCVGSGLGIQKVGIMINSTNHSPRHIVTKEVYPNPGKDIIYFKGEISSTSTISVFNMLGSQVLTFKGNNPSLDISSLVSGQYQIVIQDGKDVLVSRFVKM